MNHPSVASLADSVRKRKTTAAETIWQTLSQAQRSQPTLNAFTRINTTEAAEAAREIDETILSGKQAGSLSGVPIALKDLIDEAGLPNTLGSRFAPLVPEQSAIVVRRLQRAGAVVIGRTGLHEFAYGFSSENDWFGPVRNPWDTDLSPGGSSGGSAAAVAAGIVPAAIGTDTGGSVRVPAALCGVVGLKVTHGRVPLTGVFPLAPSLDTVGPIAASVEDAAIVYEVIAGYDVEDPWSAEKPVKPVGEAAEPAVLRMAVPTEWTGGPVTSVVSAAFERALERLAAIGVEITEVSDPRLRVTDSVMRSPGVEIAEVHRSRWEEHSDLYGTEVARRLEASFALGPGEREAALKWRREARGALASLFETHDALLTPTVGATAKRIGVDTIDVDGEPFFYRTLLSEFTAPVNRVGNPALALPIAASGAPPASLQLIGPDWAEHRLLEIGLGLEQSGIVRVEQPPHWFG